MIYVGALYEPTAPTVAVTRQLPVVMTAWHPLKQDGP
jgi:hypothetical protein